MVAASPLELIVIGDDDGLQLELMTFGATLRRLTLPTPSGRKELILSLGDWEAYAASRVYCGCVIGRCANRIADARFDLEGVRYDLTANDGANHLHGGAEGLGRRFWRVDRVQTGSTPTASLTIHSPHGDEGYPGDLAVRATFSISGTALRIDLMARSDRRTPVSLTTHPYFNLSGESSCDASRQILSIAANYYLPINSERLPLGDLAPVHGTPFDFRQGASIGQHRGRGHPQISRAAGFDHAFLLSGDTGRHATLRSPDSGVTMTLRTNQVGLQFYDGHNLSAEHPGLSGVCLEPQGLPNAVNQPAFPSVTIGPGDVYLNSTVYEFSHDAA
jgi:aldose 1-epimerase